MPLPARLAATLLVAFVISAPALAHKGATGVVMHRMSMMKDLQKAMRDMAAMLKGKRRLAPAQFVGHAATIRAHARKLPAMFPKGSNPKPSEALSTIWRDWNDFTVLMKAMETSADHLENAAKHSDRNGLRRAFVGVARTCSGCHRRFRRRK